MIAARIKQAVRKAIHLCGGIEGAAATVEKSTSHVGRWNALNEPDLPTLGDALAMDEIAVAQGKVPPILAKYAAELGHVAIRLPAGTPSEDARSAALIDALAEVGDIPATYRDRLADGSFDARDAEALEVEIEQAIEKLVVLRAVNRTAAGGRISLVRAAG